jgi:hypothetical protein
MSSATPERILDEVKRLTPDERRELREALEREMPDAPQAPSVDDRRERERRWLALEGDRLLASGRDGRAVYEAAREAGVHAPFVTRVEPRDALPFAGW